MLPRQLLSAKRADSKAHHLSDSTLTVQLKEYSLRQLRLALFFYYTIPIAIRELALFPEFSSL
ncbi:hypothetical protein AL066_26525 [Pseudomonas nunensis]|uniref:hypothetical protein n=1 Tax=Pseudomonas nunensis TaxID=2961896 RepID=UPI0006CE9BCC|nr:hypothetical protein [Pseudomonas nunensis]KPN87797.1 hypothetical protein AL066_26525 [Pseudomonas nunensis]MCL5227234.1 hypothetical protein [Pseudomonas nunensis]